MTNKGKQVLSFFHGTAVGWLGQDGFSYQKIPFGEANPPHRFLYICSLFEGAKSSALNSKTWCDRRIENDASFAGHFTRNPNGVPAAAVYTIDIGNLKSIDWAAPRLERKKADMLFPALQKIHWRKGQKLEYFARRAVMFLTRNRGWQDWVTFAGASYLSGPGYDRRLITGDDRRSIIFKLAGFQVIRNFERTPDGKYGEVAALIYGDKPYMPTRCVLV